MRRLAVLLLGLAVGLGLLRRRRNAMEFVDIRFEDGSSVRLARSTEARDLLDDAAAIIEAAA